MCVVFAMYMLAYIFFSYAKTEIPGLEQASAMYSIYMMWICCVYIYGNEIVKLYYLIVMDGV